jgi:lipopolysaccharide/colanic/teichoic acid biosynthesis glycosyltransferase
MPTDMTNHLDHIFAQTNIAHSSFSVNLSTSLQPFYVRKIPIWKRAMDITGSLIGLIILIPLFLFISFLIKIVSPGPVFFKQDRIGYGGKIFTFWKFRTMKVNPDTSRHQQYLANLIKDHNTSEDAEKPMVKLDDTDEQIIAFGRILRKSSVDELPQLINVLRGEMSLVGPRPPIPYEVSEYFQWHNDRFDAVPGMTGLWQVSGKNSLSFKEMVRLDIQYARHLSFFRDLKILILTPFAIYSDIKDGR